MHFLSLLALSSVVSFTGAFILPRQSSVDLPPQCPQNCLGSAISQTSASGECATTDYVCQCESSNYLSIAIQCFDTQCSESDAQAGLDYGIAFCQSVGVTVQIPTGSVTASEEPTSSVTTSESESSSAPGVSSATVSSVAASTTSSSAAPAATSATSTSDAFTNSVSLIFVGLAVAGVTFF